MTLSQAYAFTWHSFDSFIEIFLNANTSNLWNVHILTRPHTERVIDLIRYDAHEWICITTTTAMMMTMATMTTTMNWMALISMQHYYLSSTQRIHSSLASVGLLYIPFIHSIFSNSLLVLVHSFFIVSWLVYAIRFYLTMKRASVKKRKVKKHAHSIA